jgi:hypothetical protein
MAAPSSVSTRRCKCGPRHVVTVGNTRQMDTDFALPDARGEDGSPRTAAGHIQEACTQQCRQMELTTLERPPTLRTAASQSDRECPVFESYFRPSFRVYCIRRRAGSPLRRCLVIESRDMNSTPRAGRPGFFVDLVREEDVCSRHPLLSQIKYGLTCTVISFVAVGTQEIHAAIRRPRALHESPCVHRLSTMQKFRMILFAVGTAT